jgi:hypothetical protein
VVSISGSDLGGFSGLGPSLSDLSFVYLLARRPVGCVMVLARREVSKDAELLVLQHETAVLRRQIGRVSYQPGDRLWRSALSRVRRPLRRPPAAPVRQQRPPGHDTPVVCRSQHRCSAGTCHID